jgi:hypothetical protein
METNPQPVLCQAKLEDFSCTRIPKSASGITVSNEMSKPLLFHAIA